MDEKDLFGREPAWPDVPRLCFGDGDDHDLNACVSWVLGMNDIYPYAEGYRRAAAALFETAAARHESPDYILWPMAFMWRHYLELALKDTILRGRALEDEPQVSTELDLWGAGPSELRKGLDRHVYRNPGDWDVEALFDKLGA
jgi:hypothetical protein